MVYTAQTTFGEEGIHCMCLRNDCNNFSVDGGIPRKNGRYTSQHATRMI